MKLRKAIITVSILFAIVTISSVSAADMSQSASDVDGDVIGIDASNENVLEAK